MSPSNWLHRHDEEAVRSGLLPQAGMVDGVGWDPPVDPRITIMGPYRWSTLATYNSECARGIAHTAEWDELMAEEQRKYYDEMHR